MTRTCLAACLLLAACAEVPDDDEVVPKTFPDVLGGARPAPVVAPADVGADEVLPAVVLLHGYGVNAQLEDLVFRLQDRVERDRFLLVLPEGTVDAEGAQFWDAEDECCGFDGPDVDDVGYLGGLVDELRAGWNVGSVAFVGHSNGGYMSYRLACEVPDKLDRIVVLAGGTSVEPRSCVDGPPVGVLAIHGTADEVVSYEATTETPGTPGALEAVRRVAERNGCASTTAAVGSAADLLSGVEGAESTGVAFDGCPTPTSLWTTRDGDHLFVTATDAFRDGVIAFALGGEPVFP